MNKFDDVLNPFHYTKFYPIEPIEVIEFTKMSYNLGQIFKYLVRAPYKENELQDLKKANYYTNWLELSEVEKIIWSNAARKFIKSFYQKAINANEKTPAIFLKAYEYGCHSGSGLDFIKKIKELIDDRIVKLQL